MRRSHRPGPGAQRGWAVASLLGLAAFACGDRVAQPIVVGEFGEGLPDESEGGGTEPDGASGGENGFSVAESGDLCSPCRESSECGGERDLCVLNTNTDELFCGIRCDRDRSCPVDFHCVELRGGGDPQCVPDSGTCLGDVSDPGGGGSGGA